ncbi:MAG: hypothetical protein AB7F19_04130 [Candidatus Babeliales bacterium]
MNQTIQKTILFCLTLGANALHAFEDNNVTRTCPCAMVPDITPDTNVKKVVKAFKESSPRGQRAQLEGFINQYVVEPYDVTEAVLLACARVYSERMNNQNVYHIAQELVHAKAKKQVQKKALLAIGKVLKGPKACSVRSINSDAVETFKLAIPMQQRVWLLQYAERYASDPSEELEVILTECASIYCDRVQSQVVNKLVQELISVLDKDAIVMKLRRVLGLGRTIRE